MNSPSCLSTDATLSGFLTRRALQTQPFLVMEIMERAQALEREGRSIVHMEVGEPDFPTPRRIVEAGTEALAAGDTHYTHSLGVVELREAIAERYHTRYSVTVDAEDVLVTCGSSMAMLYVFAALVEPGDEILVATPHYACYPNFIRLFGGTMVEVPTAAADGFRLDPDVARKFVTPRTKALLLNSPSNPTGAVLDGDRLRELVGLGVPIISDEIYHGLAYEWPEHTVLEFEPDAYVVDGFSKRYAMTGWRLGYLVAPPGRMRTFQKLQQNLLISANPFVQRAGVVAIRECEPDVAAMRIAYDRRRRATVDLFRKLGFGIQVMPEGAFYVFADASRFTHDSYAFAFELLENAGVGVAPGVDFGAVGHSSIRISYAASEEDIAEGARRIGEYLSNR